MTNRFLSLLRLAVAGALLTAVTTISTVAAHAAPITIISNLAEANNAAGGDPFSAFNGEIGQAFNTGNASYTLNSVTLSLYNTSGSDLPQSVNLALWTDSSDLPGTSIVSLGSQGVNSTTIKNYTYTASGNTTLAANTTYWLVASSVSGIAVFNNTNAPDTNSTGPGSLGAYSNNAGGSFVSGNTTDNTPNNPAYGPYKFSVVGSAVVVPEAGTIPLLGAAFLPLAGMIIRRRIH